MDEMMKKILAGILAFTQKTGLTESFIEIVLRRLVSFGYELKEGDAWPISFAIQKIELQIRNFCNITSLPEGLYFAAADMVCGEFLFSMKQTGQLNLADLDLTSAVTGIKEGDVQISFAAGSSDEARFDLLVKNLMGREGDLICFRRLRW